MSTWKEEMANYDLARGREAAVNFLAIQDLTPTVKTRILKMIPRSSDSLTIEEQGEAAARRLLGRK